MKSGKSRHGLATFGKVCERPVLSQRGSMPSEQIPVQNRCFYQNLHASTVFRDPHSLGGSDTPLPPGKTRLALSTHLVVVLLPVTQEAAGLGCTLRVCDLEGQLWYGPPNLIDGE